MERALWDGEKVIIHDINDPMDGMFECRNLEDLRRSLIEIGGVAWNGSVPIERGCEVFEWASVSDQYVDVALDMNPEIVEHLHAE